MAKIPRLVTIVFHPFACVINPPQRGPKRNPPENAMLNNAYACACRPLPCSLEICEISPIDEVSRKLIAMSRISMFVTENLLRSVSRVHIKTVCGASGSPVPWGKRRRMRKGIAKIIPINAGILVLNLSDIHPEIGAVKTGGIAMARYTSP